MPDTPPATAAPPTSPNHLTTHHYRENRVSRHTGTTEDTIALSRTHGPTCRRCHATEARCAYTGSCCGACTHFANLDDDGNDRERVANCGSDSGHYAHRMRGDLPCAACKYAHTRATVRRRQDEREAS